MNGRVECSQSNGNGRDHIITLREVTNVLVQAIKDDVTLEIEAHAKNVYI